VKTRGLWVAALVAMWPTLAGACTLWAAAGPMVEGGGTLIAKSRDWAPEGHQVMTLTSPGSGLRYLGLYVVGTDEPGLKCGINERGLVVVTATVGTIPKAAIQAAPRGKAGMTALLRQCSTVDEALEMSAGSVGARFSVLADRRKVAVIEAGLEGRMVLHVTDCGTVAQTNHFSLAGTADLNQTAAGASSTTRYTRICELLGTTRKPLSMGTFVTMSRDQHDGPTNSIFRTGAKPTSTRTLATWICRVPPEGSPIVHVRLLSPGEPEYESEILADDVFSGKRPFTHAALGLPVRE
jgi:isopenicillin-N N-acyltransferase-like protein